MLCAWQLEDLCGEASHHACSLTECAAQVEDSLSRMFDDILAEGGMVRRMEPPVATIRTPLLPHQQEALAWMVDRENSDRLPPFWEVQKPKGKVRLHACT